MRPLCLFLALGFGAVWISCGGSGTDNLFPGTPGASGNVTGASGQTGTGTSGSNIGAAGVSVPTGAGGATGAGGKGAGGAAGQAGSAMGGASGVAGKGGGGGMAGSAMGGGAGSMVVDAGMDAQPDASPGPPIRCGMMSCNSDTSFCCLADPRACIPKGTDGCDRNRDRLHCDDATDCLPDEHCCAVDSNMGGPNDSACASSCPGVAAGRRVQVLCDPDKSQCTDPDTCSATQNSIFPTYAYCH